MHVDAGIIAIWHGTIATIPVAWVLCDGNNGTPDLRSRFVIAAGGALNPGDVGGSQNHNHTGTTDGHSHTLLAGAVLQPGAVVDDETALDADTFTTANANNVPPFYALAYIMKT